MTIAVSRAIPPFPLEQSSHEQAIMPDVQEVRLEDVNWVWVQRNSVPKQDTHFSNVYKAVKQSLHHLATLNLHSTRGPDPATSHEDFRELIAVLFRKPGNNPAVHLAG